MNKIQAYVRASKFYLTEELPLDFFELDEQEVTDFIRDNRWEPFEEWEPHGIWELIEDLAIDMLKIQLATVATLKEPEPKEPEPKCCQLCNRTYSALDYVTIAGTISIQTEHDGKHQY